MQRKDELIIRIENTGEIFVENIENGVAAFKRVDPSVFVECIRNSIKMQAVSSGILPSGVFYFATGEKDNKRICIEFPTRQCDIVYETTEYKDFPLPRLVFGFNLSGQHITNVDLGVADEGILTPKTAMYTYPFSNVSGFRLCCGSNKLPNIKSLHQLTGVMYFIMSMPNNNDHFNTRNTKLGLEYRHLLETLKDKSSEFYYTDVLCDNKKTLLDFVNS